MNSDESSAAGRTLLTLSEAAKESGIREMYIDSNRTLTATIKVAEIDQFSQRITIDTKKFHPMVHILMKDVRSMLKAKGVKDSIINEIGFQIGNTLNQEENYKVFRDIEERSHEVNSEDDEYKSWYLGQINELRKQHLESEFFFTEWQLSVNKKYNNLRNVLHKNFPGAWPLLQFCLAVKSILNIDGCTLPFMGVILAIPSSMKTLVIQLFRKYPFSIYSDSFTPNSFESHNAALTEKELRNVDLLPKLQNKLFLTPELAPVFTTNEDDLRKSLGIITRILDGHGLETDSGAQGHRKYGKTFFVWVGAAVEIPYRVWQLLGTLGHKIYFFRPVIPEKTIYELEKIAKQNDFQDRFNETEEILLEYLMEVDAAATSSNSRIDENGIVKVKWNEDECDEQTQAITCIAHIANLQKRLRGTVYVSQSRTRTIKNNSSYSADAKSDTPNDKADQENESDVITTAYESDYDTDYPVVEDPSRAVVMLRNLAIANAISQGRNCINLKDIYLIINVALSTTSKARSELVRLLLRKGGEATTSTIVNENRISSPFAKRTMRELAALGIVDISTVTGYSNSEFKIRLKDEYSWFKDQDFHKLFNRNEISDDKSDDDSNTPAEKEVATESSQSDSEIGNEDSKQPQRSVGDKGDSLQSHVETKSSPETHVENSDACDSFNENNSPDGSLNNSSNQLHTSQTKSDGQSKTASLDSTDTCDKEPKSGRKNNAPLWGPKSFRHVTVTRSQEHEDEKSDNEETFDYAVEQIVEEIRQANGSEIAFSSAVQSVCLHNEEVKTYLGNKLTSRENRRVRNLSVAVQRHRNIDPVKYKPQLVLRWKGSEPD